MRSKLCSGLCDYGWLAGRPANSVRRGQDITSGPAFSGRRPLFEARLFVGKISAAIELDEGRGCPTGGPPQALLYVLEN